MHLAYKKLKLWTHVYIPFITDDETGAIYRQYFHVHNVHKVNIWLNIVWKCRILCEQQNSKRKESINMFPGTGDAWRKTYPIFAQFACQFTVFLQTQISKVNRSLALWAFNSTATYFYEWKKRDKLYTLKDRDLQMITKGLIGGWSLPILTCRKLMLAKQEKKMLKHLCKNEDLLI